MDLAPGTKLAHYEIVEPIGKGGMGEVYRATDQKLGRDVAIKVLPDEFAKDDERLARFQREAKVLASLNHPNIAAIYGLEHSQGVHYLILELVPGETLAERIARGPIPIEETISIASKIAEALEEAHERSIVHRDLKPTNVKIAPDDKIKVLDFGLAKAFSGEDEVSVESSTSPTLTKGTAHGMILGTAAYMSPEQARGKQVDKRADIWSFGVVLFEMLTGRRLFEGETVSDTLAAVLRQEIDWSALPSATPANVVKLVRGCLDRDPRMRLRDIGDARIALSRPRVESEASLAASPAPLWRRAMPWAIAGALALALGFFRKESPVAPEPVLRLAVDLGFEGSLPDGTFALSPDGTVLAFIAEGENGRAVLNVRALGELTAKALLGTEGARDPFFSPDGEWIGFFARGKLRKIPVTGGAAVDLADAPNPRGGTWGSDGTIVFTPDSELGVGLVGVSEDGGPTRILTEPVGTDRWPQFLPDGRAVLFTTEDNLGNYAEASLAVVTLPDGERKVVHDGGYYGRYLPSGHLLYVYQGKLFATRFDRGRLEVVGASVPIVEELASSPNGGWAQFAVAREGTLVYRRGNSESGAVAPIHWMDRDGQTAVLRSESAYWTGVSFSPDGRRLALSIHDGVQWDVWIYDWERDQLSRLTFDPAFLDYHPIWTPDGERIVFQSNRDGPANLYWTRADGTGEVERLTESENWQLPSAWHPDGSFLIYTEESTAETENDIYFLPFEGGDLSRQSEGEPRLFVTSSEYERNPSISPDGRWIVYSVDSTGEIYVVPVSGQGRWLVSEPRDEGVETRWSKTENELYYGTADGRLMAVAYTVDGDSFRAERPRFVGRFTSEFFGGNFDVHPDGKRFAIRPIPENESDDSGKELVFVLHFFEELERLLPPH